MSSPVENFKLSNESLMIGPNTIDLIRPTNDSLCWPDDVVEPQTPEKVTKLYMANEQGPCGGVEMAEQIMDNLIEYRNEREAVTGEKIGIFANHPPSKGADRAELYKEAGISFSTPIEDIPKGSIYLFSAHGADPAEVDKAQTAGLQVMDTTCPLVGRIYKHIRRIKDKSEESTRSDEIGIAFIATTYDQAHPEIRGTHGVVREIGAKFIPITSEQEALDLADGKQVGPGQLSIAGLKRVLPTGLTTNNSDVTRGIAKVLEDRLRENGAPDDLIEPYNVDSVCRTVKFRQDAVRQMVSGGEVETIIVVGALGSNNTNELVNAALDEAGKTDPEALTLKRIVFANTHKDVPETEGTAGIVSGASTQQRNIDQIVNKLNPADIVSFGQTDKIARFIPLGGSKSREGRVLLANDFSWFEGDQ